MYSVIIVVDELLVRKGLIGIIDWESSGFQVIDEADNGEDALALIRAKKPDLVVTDNGMNVDYSENIGIFVLKYGNYGCWRCENKSFGR